MSERFIFENARIKSMETRLLTPQSVQRLLDCTDRRSLFRTLADMGFGVGAGVEQDDLDALFVAEEKRQIAFLNEFNVAGVLDPFLLKYDFLNLKSILKAIASSKKPEDKGLEGKMSFDDVVALANEENGEKLSGEMGAAILDVRALAASGKLTPRAIDVAVDRHMFKAQTAAAKAGGKIVKEHFAKEIDLANLDSFLRCKKLSLDAKFFEEGFIEGGKLDKLNSLYDSPQDALYDSLKGTEYFDMFKKAYESGNITEFEVSRDDLLLSDVKRVRDDMFSVAPILSFYLSRVTELKDAKLIAAGVTNGVDSALIKERLRNVGA